MQRPTGQVAIVTGAASGIGRATAARLAPEGARVVLTDIQDELGDESVDGIGGAGGRAEHLHSHVASEHEWREVLAGLIEAHGAIDLLVKDGGLGDLDEIKEGTLAGCERTIAIDQTEIAAPVAGLSSGDASFLIGAELYVDRGSIAR